MEKRILGKNGLEVSAIRLGCMTIGKDYSDDSKKTATQIIRRTCDLRGKFFIGEFQNRLWIPSAGSMRYFL